MDEPGHDSAGTEVLLRRIRAGDRQALDELLAGHRDFLRRFVELRIDARLRARVDPSDVVQEANLDACRRIGEFLDRNPMPFRLWLRQTAYERLLKLRRRHLGAAMRAAGREVGLPDGSSVALARRLFAPDSTPSQKAARVEEAGRVEEAIGRLPAADREVLLMRNVEGLSHAEIGCLLGIDEAAARKRYGRALLRLRKGLFGEGSPECPT
jgi:RNA polymerase sigma-70 factor (ECF subfamily)